MPPFRAGRANSGQGGGQLGRSSGDEARRPCRATASRSRATSRLRTPDGGPNHKPRKQVKDAGGTKAEAVADTQTTKFHFFDPGQDKVYT